MKYKPKKYELEILKNSWNSEKQLKKDLIQIYKDASNDITQRIQFLSTDKTRSKIQQIEYQKQLLKEVEDGLKLLNSNQTKTVDEFLKRSYKDGFSSTLYSIYQQGTPYIRGVKTERVIRAIGGTALKKPILETLSDDISSLKQPIRREITRGIMDGWTYDEMANHISAKTNITKNRASTIARTECHRIASQASMDALEQASKDIKGGVKKRWCAVMDERTRISHQNVDGETVPYDEPFSNGLMYPGDPSGPPEEVINCRCSLFTVTPNSDNDTAKKWDSKASELAKNKTMSLADYKKEIDKLSEDD